MMMHRLLAILVCVACGLLPLAQAQEAARAETTEAKPASRQVDKLELGSTVIKGNAELPKVLYIVPWQSAGPGDLDGRAMNSLLDQVLAPVDRDVFLRHVRLLWAIVHISDNGWRNKLRFLRKGGFRAMEIYSSIVGFFQNGGFFMYPVILVLAAGLAIAVERYMYLSTTQTRSNALWKEVTPFIKDGEYVEAEAITSESKSALGTILTYGLNRIKTARRRDDIERSMEESLMEVMPQLEKRTHYLATFANIATLLGLLGTIIGLIRAFTAVSGANPAEKADLLSASISVAMNTTAFGLIVAIPLLLMHAVLQTKTTEIIDSLEMASVKFLNTVGERRADGDS